MDSGLLPQGTKLAPRPDYVPAWDQLTDDWQDWEDYRMATFAAMVDRVDRNLHRIVEHLKAKNAWENTLFLLCSDNGACPFERTRGRDKAPWDPESYWTYDVGWAHAGNTPFRWYKQNQHEGGIASPLIAHWPRGITQPRGRVVHEPSHLIDLLPTIAETAGATIPDTHQGHKLEPIQGKSLAPLFQGDARDGHDYLYFHFNDNRAIRQGDWKLVSAEWGRWELYDLSNDRTELNDLASQHPDRVTKLRELWHRVARDVDGVPKRLRRPVDDVVPTFPPKQMSQRETR